MRGLSDSQREASSERTVNEDGKVKKLMKNIKKLLTKEKNLLYCD